MTGLNPVGRVTAARPLLLGHRGARNYAPENTFAAFDLTLEHGCDGIEFDVRCTSDNQLVICHDARLGRAEVSRTTYSNLAETHRCSNLVTRYVSLGGSAESAELLRLEDVLKRYGSHAFLYIEIKVAGIERAVLHLLEQNTPRRGYVVATFLPEVLHAFKDLDEQVPLGFIFDNKRELSRWATLPVRFVMPNVRMLTHDLLNEMHASSKQVFVWTVNDAERMRAVGEMGVDGVVSDDTLLLGHTFNSGSGPSFR